MRYITSAAAIIVVALCVPSTTLACSLAKPGSGMDRDELIDAAQTIVLVRLLPPPATKRGRWSQFALETVEVIKGEARPTYRFDSYDSPESDDDFNAHTSRAFWDESVGRSPWPGGMCGPDHGFREARLYLYFPDKLGAWMSAEVIRADDDHWLAYVRAKVKQDFVDRSMDDRAAPKRQ